MTLEQLNIVFQLVGTLGVIGSLIFVGLQVRQNTKTTRVQVQENMTSGYMLIAQILIDNAEVFTRGIAATRESFSSFSDARTSSSISARSSPTLNTSRTYIHSVSADSLTTNHGERGPNTC
jgi:lysine/ornithine N-monooxygenase